MFGSPSSRRRPSAKWNIKVTYRWIECVCMCVFIFVVLSRDPHSTLCVHHDHIQYSKHKRAHTFMTYIYYTHKQQGVRRGRAANMHACVCVYACLLGGWNSAGALGHAKLVLSSYQIIHEPASEMIAEWLGLSSPLSLSLLPHERWFIQDVTWSRN